MRVRGALLFLAAAALATAASAQTKVSGELSCGQPDPMHKIDAPDGAAGHALTLVKIHCTWTKSIDLGGAKLKDGDSVGIGEVQGNSASERGFHVDNVDNGDKLYVRYQGTSVSKDGKPVSGKGTYTFAGGTGKMKGIKGKGTYSGKPDDKGNMVFQVEGEYTFATK